jgi:hypothetical protein
MGVIWGRDSINYNYRGCTLKWVEGRSIFKGFGLGLRKAIRANVTV